jgi:hypothetical protein
VIGVSEISRLPACRCLELLWAIGDRCSSKELKKRRLKGARRRGSMVDNLLTCGLLSANWVVGLLQVIKTCVGLVNGVRPYIFNGFKLVAIG